MRPGPNDVLPIERELLAERASALAQAGEHLEAALVDLGRWEAQPASALAGEESVAWAARRRELRAIAAERLWYLMIQREAIGVREHEGVFRDSHVPRDLLLLAGPRRR